MKKVETSEGKKGITYNILEVLLAHYSVGLSCNILQHTDY